MPKPLRCSINTCSIALAVLLFSTSSLAQYRQIEWTELMPEDDLEAFLNPPVDIQNIEEGSAGDNISSQIKAAPSSSADNRYQQALASTRVIAQLDGEAIRIPAFVVPVEFDESQRATQFFLVPYFGACIHVPPPPPNQIIFANYPEGLKLDNLYQPFWFLGTLSTTLTENEIATAAYSMLVNRIETYDDE